MNFLCARVRHLQKHKSKENSGKIRNLTAEGQCEPKMDFFF